MKTKIYVKTDAPAPNGEVPFSLKATIDYSFLLKEGDYVFFRGQRHTVVHVEHNLTPPDVSQDLYIRPWQKESN